MFFFEFKQGVDVENIRIFSTSFNLSFRTN